MATIPLKPVNIIITVGAIVMGDFLMEFLYMHRLGIVEKSEIPQQGTFQLEPDA